MFQVHLRLYKKVLQSSMGLESISAVIGQVASEFRLIFKMQTQPAAISVLSLQTESC